MKKLLVLAMVLVVGFSFNAEALKYRIQVDLDFNTQEDADAFEAYVNAIDTAKLYDISLDEVIHRTDLYTSNRMYIIKDYDDEGNNQPGVSVRMVTLKQPITR